MTTRRPTHAAAKMRAGVGIGRTIIALVVVVVIFLVLALFLVFGGEGEGPPKLSNEPSVGADLAAARADYPQIGGTASEHVRLAQRLAAAETGPESVRAFQEYRKALALDPDNVEALLGIASISPILDREGVDFSVERALAYCNAVSTVYPDDPRPHRVKARISMSLRGWSGGVDAWNRVLAMYPEDQEALVELGRCFMELDRHDEAVAQLARVAASAADPTEARLLLAETQLRSGRFVEAYGALDGIPARGRAAADAAVLRAQIYEAVGDTDSAREQVRIALRFDGNHPGALLRDAVFSYQDAGDLYNAREALLRIVNRPDIEYERELRDATALHLGIVYRAYGHYDQAHRYLDPLVARKPDDLTARFHWTKVRLAEGSVAELIGPLEDDLRERDCQRPEPWFLLGQLCSRSDDLEGLVRAFEHAIDVDPGFAPAYLSLVAVLEEFESLDQIELIVNALYAHEERRPLLNPVDRGYHDAFDLAEIEGPVGAAARALEQRDPRGLAHLKLRALLHYHSGDFTAAAPLFESLVERGEGAAIHRLYSGRVALADDRYPDATTQLTAAAEVARNDPLYLYLAHRLFEAEGRAEQAAEGYQLVLALLPSSALGAHGMGRLAHRGGDLEGAREWYRRAHDADPEFRPAWRDHLRLDQGEPPDPAVP